MFAVESTDTSTHCGIQARNIKLFRSWKSAKRQAVRFALTHRGLDENSKHNFNRKLENICWDGFLDKTQKVFDASDGTEETAPVLAWITKITAGE